MLGRMIHFSVGMMLILTILAGLNRYYPVVPMDVSLVEEVRFPVLPEIPQAAPVAPVAAPKVIVVPKMQMPTQKTLNVIYSDHETHY